MKDCIKRLDELIEYCRRQINEFGWFRNERSSKKYNVILAVLTVLLAHKVRNAGSECSFLQIITDICRLPQFHDISEKELILTILLFYFDKELLVRSKELISYSWHEDGLESNIGHGKPRRRQKYCGLSLVLFFKYPESLLKRLNKCVEPIELIHRTASDHFTLMNFATRIHKDRVDKECNSIKRKLNRRIQADKDLKMLITQLSKNAVIRDEFRVLRDGALILYGAGCFLRIMHEIRLRLRKLAITRSNGTILERDPLPLWSHTVFGRIGQPLTSSQISHFRRMISQILHDTLWKLEQ